MKLIWCIKFLLRSLIYPNLDFWILESKSLNLKELKTFERKFSIHLSTQNELHLQQCCLLILKLLHLSRKLPKWGLCVNTSSARRWGYFNSRQPTLMWGWWMGSVHSELQTPPSNSWSKQCSSFDQPICVQGSCQVFKAFERSVTYCPLLGQLLLWSIVAQHDMESSH